MKMARNLQTKSITKQKRNSLMTNQMCRSISNPYTLQISNLQQCNQLDNILHNILSNASQLIHTKALTN